MIPNVLSHYRILREIGEGGMGTVYLAEDVVLGRKVAIKVLTGKAGERAGARLVREAQAVARLDHPNICVVHEIGQDGPHSFIVMAYVEGETLARKLQDGSMDWRESLSIAVQVAGALADAHSHSIIHRDIKPQNVMLTPGGQVKVLDFGLAKFVEDENTVYGDADTRSVLTNSGAVVGTAAYMSPEQVRAEDLDVRTDVFSFGALLYEMLTGRQPFEGATWGATISAVLTYDPPPLALHVGDVPAFLERVVRRCLAKRREDRYDSMRELLADLTRARDCLDSGVATVIDGEPPPRARVRRLAPALALLGLLLAAGYGAHLATQPDQKAPGEPGVNSIAVLPFENVSASPETEYLSDGVTDSLINSLSQVPRLRVIGRGSVFRYKDQAADPQQVGKKLSVDAVLTGRVLRQGDTLVVRVELTSVADGTHLWGEQYTRKFEDIFAVQDQISGAIADRLRLRLSGEEQRRARKRYTDDAEAYTLYLKGRYFWNKRTLGDLEKSIDCFNQALARDPDYALAYAGLADSYTVLGSGGYDGMRPAEAWPKAEAAARRALEIDDALAEAHTSLAVVKLNFTRDWKGAENDLRRAIELNPSYATAHYYYSRYLNLFGRNEESIAESRRAEAIEPLVPTLSVNVARAYSFARQPDKVIEQSRRALELDPGSWQAYWFLGIGHLHMRRYDEALAAFQKVRGLTDDSPTSAAGLGFTYALAGEREKAEAILRDLERRSRRQYISPENFALIYACLGDNDRAFYWLERAYQDHSTTLPNLRADPLFDGLRSDPRYESLLRRLGLGA